MELSKEKNPLWVFSSQEWAQYFWRGPIRSCGEWECQGGYDEGPSCLGQCPSQPSHRGLWSGRLVSFQSPHIFVLGGEEQFQSARLWTEVTAKILVLTMHGFEWLAHCMTCSLYPFTRTTSNLDPSLLYDEDNGTQIHQVTHTMLHNSSESALLIQSCSQYSGLNNLSWHSLLFPGCLQRVKRFHCGGNIQQWFQCSLAWSFGCISSKSQFPYLSRGDDNHTHHRRQKD